MQHGSRARSVLFMQASLQKKQSQYPTVGQKKLGGAAARMLIYFCAEIAHELHCKEASDRNRPIWQYFFAV